jgi:A/G-specific adenine glycosylase
VWTAIAITPVLLGHIVIAAGVLPGYRGVWRSMHLGGRLRKDTADRVWPACSVQETKLVFDEGPARPRNHPNPRRSTAKMPAAAVSPRQRMARSATTPTATTRAPDVAVFRRELSRWGRKHRRSFPWRETDEPFRILVAEILLQRSRGRTVAKVYERLFERWPTALALSRARASTIEDVIRPLGLTRRAVTLKELAGEVVRLGGVPRTLESLQALPGVGPYAAGATVVVAFGGHAPVVDGVTARVYRRYFGLPDSEPASTDKELWQLVDEATPPRGRREWNWAVLDLASSVCLPKIPRCRSCPLTTGCAWSAANA